MAEYGIPYMGSKSSISNEIVKIFPKADHFYDLFGGGFSITHAMLLRRSKDYKQFHFNEPRKGVCDLIKKAISGEFNYKKFKPKFISKEEFHEKKELDPYIKLFWSFGNNCKGYLFSKEIEDRKKSLHQAVVFNEFDGFAKKIFGMDKFKDGFGIKQKRLFLKNKIAFHLKTKNRFEELQQLEQLERLQQLQQLEQLERLQQLQQLEQLERLQQLSFYSDSYDEIEIKENSIIYCDPPYAGTSKYDSDFDTKSFLNWCDNQKNPVFISEYEIKDPRFHVVFKIRKRSLQSGVKKNNLIKEEKIYVNKVGKELVLNKM